MKFSTTFTDAIAIDAFFKSIITMAKLCKFCTLRLEKDKLTFIHKDTEASTYQREIQLNIAVSSMFRACKIAGPAEDINYIIIEMAPIQLANLIVPIVSSTHNIRQMRVRLISKDENGINNAYLACEMSIQDRNGESKLLVHEVPIITVRVAFYEDYGPPARCNHPTVSIQPPSLRYISSLIVCFKTMGVKTVKLSANAVGDMLINAETPRSEAELTVQLGSLRNYSSDDMDIDDPQEMQSVRVDIVPLLQLCQCPQFYNFSIMMRITNHRMVRFLAQQDDIQFYYAISHLSE